MTETPQPLTDQQLDEYEALAANATLLGADIASPGILTVLVAEVRRLRALPVAAPSAPADRAARSEQYAAAIRETDGWVLDDGQHMIDAVMTVADAEQAELRREHAERMEHLEGALARLRAVVERVRRLHGGLDAETDLASPDDEITRGAAARKIAAALDGYTPPAAPPVPSEPVDRAAELSPAERTMLNYALNQAQVRMWATGKFTDEDQAAVVSLRRLTAEAQQPAPWLSDSARIGRTLIWTWADIGKGVYGQGYRAAQTEARALLTGQRDSDEAQQPETQAGCGCPNENAVEHQFGTADCTCIPFVREGGTARYCQPGDTVDQISGWERGGDCPHHRPDAVEAQQPKEEPAIHIGGNAEDCPGCSGSNPPYPFICPGPDAVVAPQPEAPQPEAREWCKCPSCWGWFVEEHPGEDLDELGRDLRWWSGLPEHRDAPSAVEAQQPKDA